MAGQREKDDRNDAEMSLPGKPEQIPGLPENITVITFDGFDGMNTKPTRPAIEDQEMFYAMNFMPLADSGLRTMYDIGSSIFKVS